MKLSRPRFTLRWLMTAATVAAILGATSAWCLLPRAFDLRPYVDALEQIRLHPPTASGYLSASRCYVELGPPLRVAFVEDGLLDNWHGIVYDPTGLVLRANLLKGDYSNRGDPRLNEVLQLFGGMMIRAVPLGGPWYRCYFT